MQTILILVDGSKPCDAAVKRAIREARLGQVERVHLVNVQPHLGAYVGRFVGTPTIRAFQREQGERALAHAKYLLDDAGVPYSAHIYVGDVAETIAKAADELGVTEIVMTADGFGLPGGLATNSLIGKVIRRTNVPVSVVKAAAGDLDLDQSASQWQLRPTH
ncbi:MAG TPA: universal stress protein [Alphaproteobacteria bacterium]|nr:universal stress protein [Alphaproteobacteria bacterium]